MVVVGWGGRRGRKSGRCTRRGGCDGIWAAVRVPAGAWGVGLQRCTWGWEVKRPVWFEYIRVRERQILGSRQPPDFVPSFGPAVILAPEASPERAERKLQLARDWIWQWMQRDYVCLDAVALAQAVVDLSLAMESYGPWKDWEKLLAHARAIIAKAGAK